MIATVRARQPRAQVRVSTISPVRPGLLQRDREDTTQVYPGSVGGRDRRQAKGGQPARKRMQQIAAIDRRVVGGTAADKQDMTGVPRQSFRLSDSGSNASIVERSVG